MLLTIWYMLLTSDDLVSFPCFLFIRYLLSTASSIFLLIGGEHFAWFSSCKHATLRRAPPTLPSQVFRFSLVCISLAILLHNLTQLYYYYDSHIYNLGIDTQIKLKILDYNKSVKLQVA